MSVQTSTPTCRTDSSSPAKCSSRRRRSSPSLAPHRDVKPLDLLRAQERQHAGDDRHLHAVLVAQVVLELEEITGIVEELGDEEFGAAFDLCRGAIPVEVLVRALDVAFGVAGGADGEAAPVTNETHQVEGKAEAARRPAGTRPARVAGRRVGRGCSRCPASCASSSTAPSISRVGAGAGEVGHRLDAEILAQPLDHAQRAVAGTAAGPVGDRDEGRMQTLQGGDDFLEERCFAPHPSWEGKTRRRRPGGIEHTVLESARQTPSQTSILAAHPAGAASRAAI